MSKQTTPSLGVPVTLGGEQFYLRYSLRTRKRLRELNADTFNEDSIPILIYEGLKDSAPDLTVDDVEDLVDLEHLPEIMDAVVKAMGSKRKFSEMFDKHISKEIDAVGETSATSIAATKEPTPSQVEVKE